MINNKGVNNPMYGKKHSEATKRKIAEARKKYRREKAITWKGGRRISANGYIELYIPEHHRARKNGYVFEHIVIAEKTLCRELKVNEQVHHKNKIKTDNRPENLQVLDASEHSKLHSTERKRKGKHLKCIVCGKEFYRKPSHVERAKCCSSKCVGHYTHLKNKGELA